MRRAQAYEACERYKSALQDVRQVLAYGQEKEEREIRASGDVCVSRVSVELKNTMVILK